ncbi:response regulator [Pseudomonas sp. 2,4-D]|uniref:response regulator n=1 Tax=Pseudomonas sp. 2,4-D TaxID=3058433 RepID=UPI00262CA2D1|nr:response regulator [Pseudomonas sp. 2,4-D]MDN4514676.1 response regulator [Pseudomonas sp. 2,4-D]
MRILLVEDNQEVLLETKKEIEKITGKDSVITACSKESACTVIKDEFFDLIVLDLSLPTINEGLDADVAHGQAVFHYCLSMAPGTPICFLTGSSTHRFVNQLLNAHANRQDFWGQSELNTSPMVFQKINLDDFLEHLKQCSSKLRNLADIELRSVKAGGALAVEEQRLLKMFTIKLSGASCKWQDLNGGLSGVRVLSVEVLNQHDSSLFKAVARIGKRDKISLEATNFDLMVPALTIGTFPSKLLCLEYGAKSSAAIYYRLANDHTSNLSELLLSSPELSLTTYQKLKEIFSVWGEGCYRTRKTIGELRSCLVSDSKLARLKNTYELSWLEDIEDLSVSVKWGRTHGDMHGGNVLIANDYAPLIIDFGDLAERATSLDPCSILLSPFFHLDTAERALESLPKEDLIRSIELLNCGTNSPLAPFFNQITEWISEECSRSERSIYASILIYVIKQLNYPDTNKDVALNIISVCKERILSTI